MLTTFNRARFEHKHTTLLLHLGCHPPLHLHGLHSLKLRRFRDIVHLDLGAKLGRQRYGSKLDHHRLRVAATGEPTIMKVTLISVAPRRFFVTHHTIHIGRWAKTIPMTIAKQRWEENHVPPGVPICLTRENSYKRLREKGRGGV
jgi:hypothetical protein